MKTKIIASTSVIGAALVAVALAVVPTFEANAENIPALSEEPIVELTGPQAGAFATCAKDIWTETIVVNVKQFVLWRGTTIPANELVYDPDSGLNLSGRTVMAYTIELVTTNEETFAALDTAHRVWSGDGCDVIHATPNVTYCIKRGSIYLSATQIACVKAAAIAVIGSVQGVETIHLKAGPPRTLEASVEADKTPAEYAACRAARPPTCKPVGG